MQVGDFSRINMVPDGDIETPIYVSIKGFTPSSGGSGHVEPGNYEVEITRAAWVARKEKAGRNFKLECKTVGPEKYAGVPIVSWKPAEKGDNGLGYAWFQGLAWALASYAGALEKVQAMEAMALAPKALIGKRFCVNLRNGKEQYADRSEINRFVGREEYLASPGPSGGIAGASESPAQTSRPEVLPANGSTKIATVDASIPF